MATNAVPFSNFAYGEYGSLSPFNVGYRNLRGHSIYSGWWTGQNIMRGANGTLFPRVGEKPYVLTGMPNGVLAGMGGGDAGGHPYVWFAVGTTVYRFRADVPTQAIESYTGALGAFTEPLAWVDHSGVSYVFAYPAGMYKLDHGAKTVANIAAGPQAYNCTIYGDRLMAGSASRLYYSAAGDFESWPANNYVDIGDVFNITSLDTIRGRLAIGKDGVFGQPWFLMSGVPGFNDVLRQVEVSLTPAHDEASVDMGEGVALITGIEGTLAVFDGSRLRPIPHLKVKRTESGGVPSEYSVFKLRRPGEWGAVLDPSVDAFDAETGSIWLYRNAAWTRHKRATPAGVVAGAWVVQFGFQNRLVFGQGGDPSTPAAFSCMNPYLERPPNMTDPTATILDPADCFFSLPEWWQRDASDVAVREVVVDFLAYDTGDPNPNTFTCNAVAMRTYDPQGASPGGDVTTGPNRTYSEAAANAAPLGSRRRFVFKYPLRWGNGFRLDFTNLRGVAVEKVVAVVETRGAQGL